MKIIHIVENLDKGAVENWLVNVFIESRTVRPTWTWTFYCLLGKPGRLDEKVRNAGGIIIYSPVTISDKKGFLKHLRQVLKFGDYDIIHSHHDYLSGFYLLASRGIKFRKRFLQVHNTDKALPVGNRVLHNLLLKPFRKIATYYSDTVIGISRDTLEEFAKTKKLRSSKHALLYYGINMTRFEAQPDTEQIRSDLGVPKNAKILLFAGRMTDLKNPPFVIEVLKELLKMRSDVYAVFVGTGDLSKEVEAKASAYQISNHVRIKGWHDNVPMLMKASDVFVFPRKEYPKEGLGLVIVEAQAAGLPMFITNGIVPDAIEIPELAHISQLDNPRDWATKIDAVLNSPRKISQEDALKKMQSSKFELGNATLNLIKLYEA